MCKIADAMKPPKWQVSILSGLSKLAPSWAITPVLLLSLKYKDYYQDSLCSNLFGFGFWLATVSILSN
jgi:hypothetical protein